MRAALTRRCTVFGCSQTFPCGIHFRKPSAIGRTSARERGYDSRWSKARLGWLRKHPFCGDRAGQNAPVMSACHAAGVVTQATQVDHVIPHRGDTALFWDSSNWQSLCASCGGRKSRAGL